MWGNLKFLVTKRFGQALTAQIPIFCSAGLRANNFKRLSSIHKRPGAGTWICHAGLLTYLGLKEVQKTAEEEVTDIIKMAILAQQANQPKKAEQLLHLALKIAQEQLSPLATTHIFDIMANLALEVGDHAKAERLFKEVLKRMMGGATGMALAENDNALIEISIKLADIYSEMGRFGEAESGYDFCVKQLTAKMKSTSTNGADVASKESEAADTAMLWAMCNDSLGRHLIKLGKLETAVGHFAIALDTCRRINGPDHPQTLVLVNNLGSVSSMGGDQVAAAEYLSEAVRIARVTDSPDLAAYHRNLGMIYLHMGRLQEATEACKQALNESTASGSSEYRSEAYRCLQDIADIKKEAQKNQLVK